ncbi:MAG TPA: helix-turn-helix domain-containing protein [bacterium]|nr:helix-turn-helix domain-containing protein [bacterium]
MQEGRLQDAFVALARAEIRAALEETRGNRQRAAHLLGVDRRTLYGYLDRLFTPEEVESLGPGDILPSNESRETA